MKNFVKLVGIIALVAVIVFSMAACGEEPEAEPEPVRKSIQLTGLPAVSTYSNSNGVIVAEEWLINLFDDDGIVAYGTHGGMIANYDNRTISLSVPNETIKNDAGFTVPKPWTGSGNFYIKLSICREGGSIRDYYYTNGKTFGELGITNTNNNEWHQKLPQFNIIDRTHTIPFSNFFLVP